ncbi:alanine--tRNA ligase [Spiroplasma endosymbiont of Crioceris asparagi]|uniref:alanine--tRNA ligase n=1 Tax=Spiroplasma endosymbiont of Crioceris asparagi TaxID=3066286 RepID=UPI0030D408A1
MKKLSTNEIRKMWLDFFISKKHHFLDPVSLVPINDPSLLWINSGVATLKPYFDGRLNPPSKRLTNAQKAIRTNDIENVGVTARHHTLFEMLGNFSIGDYFKKEAITFAWELLTSEQWFGLNKNKLYITVYEKDNDAYDIWTKDMGVEKDHIFKCSRETNFWDVGQGPCGPNTEIFYDRGEEWDLKKIGTRLLSDDIENDRYIEIWNIVFSTFNNDGKNNYTELPRKNIDTGAGLERLASIFQNAPTNFETDLFLPIIREIEKYTKEKYTIKNYLLLNEEESKINTAFKVIADHVRASAFAIADGVFPSNKDRGYVIRRLIRRSCIYAKSLKINEIFLYKLVDVVINIMKSFYTNLEKQSEIIKSTIKEEEEKFFKTVTKGIEIINELIKTEKEISAKNAMLLFESYGFPIELTKEISEQNNIKIDLKGFKNLLEEAKQNSRAFSNVKKAWNKQSSILTSLDVVSKFVGYETLTTNDSKVSFMFKDDEKLNIAKANDVVNIILDKTPFYAEKGGQAADNGYLIDANNIKHEVCDVQSGPNGQSIHTVKLNADIKVDDVISTLVNEDKRLHTAKNHSGTHILHAAIREVLGQNAMQTGSYNDDHGLRIDITFNRQPTEAELTKILLSAKNAIAKKYKREVYYTSIKEAVNKYQALAFFTEKYDSTVRVVKFGDYSSELCGGTHVDNLADIEDIFITNVESKGSGVYRFHALTSLKTINNYLNEQFEKQKNEISSVMNKYLNNFSKIQKDKELDKYIKELNSLEVSQENLFKLKKIVNDFKNKFKLFSKQIENQLLENNVRKYYNEVPKDMGDHKELEIITTDLDINGFKKLSDVLQNKFPNLIFKGFNLETKIVVFSVGKDLQNKYSAIELFRNETKYKLKGGGNEKLAQGKIL